MTGRRYSLKKFIAAITAICLVVAGARYWYVGTSHYELRAAVQVNFGTIFFQRTAEARSDLASRINVSDLRLANGGARFGNKVDGCQYLQREPSYFRVDYLAWARTQAQLETALGELRASVDELLARNQDLECGGVQVWLVTHPPIGRPTTKTVEDTWKVVNWNIELPRDKSPSP